ncbi:lysophospholipid acyltransferase family protein [Paracidobacterium acidisoli]|uniref:Lipid A biosynthesis acyltransferase n=1 Tax=Paracidobacterium acidisoli TaxID=2303751 RepID=A0A372IUT9_9BACT|nr:lysophospholipid acyltransferase family protein [Paracidobacterium acidisoli]MBT9329738.1 lysophospholipid acyltransferase family protein [Paracidobacterium acidisoli]
MREALEFAVVWTLVKLLGALPRPVARRAGAAVGAAAWRILPRLRRVGIRNLELAFPQMPAAEREQVLRRLYRNLGWLLAEFCRMPRYTRENTSGFLCCEGLDHYLSARDRGKGVLIVTGHLGAWELSSFYHSLMGYPMSMVIRRLDNPRVDALVNSIRCRHGNRVLHKDDFARGLLAAMRQGETVGILMDTNMTPPQGVFVPFFDHMACTASGLARVALKTGAAVLPGFMLWEESGQKYVLRFGPEIPLVSTGDSESDIVENTARFTSAIEQAIRTYPDQWLWVHRRWKTRPEGEKPVY